MPDQIREVHYQYFVADTKNAQTAELIGTLTEAGIDLLAVSVLPHSSGKVQVNLVTTAASDLLDSTTAGTEWALSEKLSGFHIQGESRPNAIGELLARLTTAEINVTSVQAIAAGAGRYGALLWVNPADVEKAAEVLEALPLKDEAPEDLVDEISEDSFPASDPPSFSPTSIG